MYTSPQGGNNELAYDRKKIYSFTFLIPTLSSDCFLSLLSEFQVPYLIHHWGAELSEFFSSSPFPLISFLWEHYGFVFAVQLQKRHRVLLDLRQG